MTSDARCRVFDGSECKGYSFVDLTREQFDILTHIRTELVAYSQRRKSVDKNGDKEQCKMRLAR